MKAIRAARAACFGALALVSLLALGFGLAITRWHEPGRTIVSFAGYLAFVVFILEAARCWRGERDRLNGFGGDV
jgi:hypothetical protein